MSRAKKWRIIRAGGSLNVTLDFEMLAAWQRDGVLAEIAAALPREIVERWAAIIVRAGHSADLQCNRRNGILR